MSAAKCAERLSGEPCTKAAGHEDWHSTGEYSWSTPLEPVMDAIEKVADVLFRHDYPQSKAGLPSESNNAQAWLRGLYVARAEALIAAFPQLALAEPEPVSPSGDLFCGVGCSHGGMCTMPNGHDGNHRALFTHADPEGGAYCEWSQEDDS